MKRDFSKFSIFHLFLVASIVATALVYYKLYFATETDLSFPPTWVFIDGVGDEAISEWEAKIVQQLTEAGFTQIDESEFYEGSFKGSPPILLSLIHDRIGLEPGAFKLSIHASLQGQPLTTSVNRDLASFESSLKSWMDEAGEKMKRDNPRCSFEVSWRQ
jgi:hypothetical protein